MRFQKQQKTICNFRKKKKRQGIAFLEHKNFIFRKIICNFAAV